MKKLNSVAESTGIRLQNPEEPIENWMARNKHLWVYTPHVSEVMITLGVTNVSDLQEFIFVEDLVDKGINKVTACKILQLVGGVRYRPGGPGKSSSFRCICTGTTIFWEQRNWKSGGANPHSGA